MLLRQQSILGAMHDDHWARLACFVVPRKHKALSVIELDW
eukprot:COSAG04_NODE_26710_length_291_cov_1.328125_1_plen_39_part_01